MNISQALLDEVVAHALEDPANEVCGVIAVADDAGRAATRVYRATNIHASPLRFEIDAMELLELHNAIEEQGEMLGAIYHSHVRSRPYPSQTDVNFAANWPDVEWVIVGLGAGEKPEVRSYLIKRGAIEEVPIPEPAG
jgi:proteasome lid subunit RPN8/RPN11